MLGDLTVKIGADVKELQSGIRRAQSQLKNFGSSISSAGRSLTTRLSLPIAAVGGLAIKTAADFESLRMSMDALNGSAEEGARNFERLKEFSAGTPFQLKDLAEAQNMLQGFGQTADDAFESVGMIGDIAAITGSDIKGIGVAFGQAAAEGKVMTRDIRQFINQGVPMIKLLAETMGVAQSEVLNLAEQGEISFDILQKAFRDATSEGGLFANGMEKQANTISGVFSTLKDNVSIALAELGQEIFDTLDLKELIKSVTTNIGALVERFQSLSKETRKMAIIVAGAIGAGGPILVAIGALTMALGAISWPVVLGVTAFIGATTAIVKNWDKITAYFTSGQGAEIWTAIKSKAKELFSLLKTLFKNGTEAVSILWDNFGGAIVIAFQQAIDSLITILTVAFEALRIVLNIASGRWLTDWDGFTQDILESWISIFDTMEENFKGFARRTASIMVKLGSKVGATIGDTVLGALASLDLIPEELEGAVSSSVDKFGKKYNTTFNEAQEKAEGLANWISVINNRLSSLSFPSFTGGDTEDTETETKVDDSQIESAKTNVASFGNQMKGVSMEAVEFGNRTAESFMKVKTQAKVMGQALQSTVTNSITSFAETLGNALTGDAGAESFFKNILLIVTDFANQFGKLLIGAGVAALAFEQLLANPVAAIAAGAALVAATTAIKNLLSDGPATKVNDALITSSGEVVKFHPDDNILAMKDFGNLIPDGVVSQGNSQRMPQKIEVFGRLDGKDIYVSGERGGIDWNR